MSYTTEQIRNIAIIGHGGTGKTTLLEHILFQGGMISKPETVDSGKTVSDYGDDEIARKISVRSSLTHVNTDDCKINLIDAPGAGDFVGEAILAIRAAETALLVIDGKSGVQIETIKLWRLLERHQKPRMVFVTRLDEERANYEAALADIKEKFRAAPVPSPFRWRGPLVQRRHRCTQQKGLHAPFFPRSERANREVPQNLPMRWNLPAASSLKPPRRHR
jgi:elongation factor G